MARWLLLLSCSSHLCSHLSIFWRQNTRKRVKAKIRTPRSSPAFKAGGGGLFLTSIDQKCVSFQLDELLLSRGLPIEYVSLTKHNSIIKYHCNGS